MRVRLNLWLEDLSHRFAILVSTAADVFCKLIDTMHAHLKFLIDWPTQKTCRTNIPQIFLPKVTLLISIHNFGVNSRLLIRDVRPVGAYASTCKLHPLVGKSAFP